MIKTLQKHHVRALKRALNILIDHLNEGRAESAGWAGGMQIGGWLTGDQLTESGHIELSADSKKSDLNTRRYRITQKGIDALIRLGDTLTLKDGRTGTLCTISSTPGDYRLQLDIAGNLEWIMLTALDIESITSENAVINSSVSSSAHVATLTSPEIKVDDGGYTVGQTLYNHRTGETGEFLRYYSHTFGTIERYQAQSIEVKHPHSDNRRVWLIDEVSTTPAPITEEDDDDDFSDDNINIRDALAETVGAVRELPAVELPAIETPAETPKPETLLILENSRLQRENAQLVKQLEAQRTKIIPADEFTTLKEAHAAAQRKIDALKKALAEKTPAPESVGAVRELPAVETIVATQPETVIEIRYFWQSIESRSAEQFEKYIREGWRIAHESFVVQGDAIIHVARLEREVPATPAPETTFTRTVWEAALDAIDEDPTTEEIPVARTVTASIVPDAIIGLDPVGAVREQPADQSFTSAVRRAIKGEITMDEALAIGDEQAMSRARAAFNRRRVGAVREQPEEALPVFRARPANLLKG